MKCHIDSLSINYLDEGAGRVVVLLHGWASSVVDFDGIAQKLQSSYRVVRVDLPGFGASEQPPEDWYVGDYATFVQQFLAEIGVSDVYAFVGHSFGGRIIIKGMATETLVAEKLILIGAAGVKHSDSLRNQLLSLVAKTGKFVLSLPGLRGMFAPARARLYQRIGSTDYLDAGSMQQIFLHTINEDLSEYASHITRPTLLVWGSEDDQAPLADGKFYHEQIAESRLKIAASAGHFVHHDEPIQVERWIKDFLDA